MKYAVVKTWRGDQEVTLNAALTPYSHYDEGGVAESAQHQADAASEAIGVLLAYLVEKGHLTLDEAKEIAGVYDDIEILDPEGNDT